MNLEDIVDELRNKAQDSIKHILLKHGAREPVLGVKIEALKKIQKRVKKDHELSLALFNTGIYDAMYLAGLVADETKISKAELKQWAKSANSPGISEYTVPWIAAESLYGLELGLEWIESKDELIASSGWATLSSYVAIRNDADIDTRCIEALLDRVVAAIHKAPNRVRYAMNNFVIAVGSYIGSLTDTAKKAGSRIGKITVIMEGTACKVPDSVSYITKVEAKGTIGKKRKQARC